MKKSAPKPVAAPSPAKKKAASPVAKATPTKKISAAPKPKPTAKAGTAPRVTVITARINIGFGNTLHLRGDGPGLSWHQGVPLTCAADDAWTLTLPAGPRPVAFKFLVNDLTWSSGPDYVVAPGMAVELVPVF